MLKFLLISPAVICLLAIAELSSAQVRPYMGVSGSLGAFGPGWGPEAGMRFFSFYAGFEYGIASPWPHVDNAIPSISPNPYETLEKFGGIHLGYVFDTSYFVGIVLLESFQTWDNWDSVSRVWVPSRQTLLNIGPDFRYSGLANGHLYLAFAYPDRRGFKAGIGYMF